MTERPYAEIKEYISGYIVVKSESIDGVVKLAQECPILKVGGNVEVRATVSPEDNK